MKWFRTQRHVYENKTFNLLLSQKHRHHLNLKHTDEATDLCGTLEAPVFSFPVILFPPPLSGHWLVPRHWPVRTQQWLMWDFSFWTILQGLEHKLSFSFIIFCPLSFISIDNLAPYFKWKYSNLWTGVPQGSTFGPSLLLQEWVIVQGMNPIFTADDYTDDRLFDFQIFPL